MENMARALLGDLFVIGNRLIVEVLNLFVDTASSGSETLISMRWQNRCLKLNYQVRFLLA